MKKIIAAFLVLTPILLWSQVTLRGKVVEKNSQQPLEFATVILSNPTQPQQLTGATTDQQGQFSLKARPGTYTLRVEFIGFKTYEQTNFVLKNSQQLPTISLREDATALDEVEVIAEKSTTEYKLDKRVFNVGKDLLSKGGSVNDILNNVPSVNVDVEGGISLRGNPNVRILINGKPSVLTNNNGLEQIPSESIEKVEVITNPSAKYDAEGTAGIINIILKKNKKGGFGSSLQLNTGIPDNHGINYNINYKQDKFNLFSNLRYRHMGFNGYSSLNRTDFVNGTPNSYLDRLTSNRTDYRVFNLYLGSDYYINDKNTLTLSYYHRSNVIKNKVDYDIQLRDANRQVTQSFANTENYREPQKANQLEINYVKDFDKKGQKLTVNFQFDWWNDDENETVFERQLLPTAVQSSLSTRDIESSQDFLFQSDFRLPVHKKSHIEMGIKGEVRFIDSDYTVKDNNIVLDRFTNLLEYHEGIYGAYIQYGNREGKLQYLLGLRAEHSNTGSTDRKGAFETDKKYTNLFPTVHLTYNFSSSNNLQLSYSRRIRRPRFWQLNPFGGYTDRRNYRIGNPDLNPMFTNSFELGSLKRWKKVTINPSVYFQHTTNLFETQVFIAADGALVSKPVNSGTEDRLGAELALRYSPLKWLRLSSEINYFGFQQRGLFNTKDQVWTARLNARMRFKTFSMQSSANYQGARKSGQILTKSNYAVNIGASQDLWGDKASVSLNVNNIFDSRAAQRLITGENYTSQTFTRRMGRTTSLSFIYRFNRTKKDRDRLPD